MILAHYGSVTNGNQYFATRMQHEVWDVASEDDKTRSLYSATRIIDNLNFSGDRTSETQELEFPRGGDTTTPSNVELACYEIAYALLDGRDTELEAEMLNEDQASFGEIRVRSDKTFISEALVHGVPSVLGWNLLKPYLRDKLEITLVRVS